MASQKAGPTKPTIGEQEDEKEKGKTLQRLRLGFKGYFSAKRGFFKGRLEGSVCHGVFNVVDDSCFCFCHLAYTLIIPIYFYFLF